MADDTVKYSLGKDAVVICNGSVLDNVQDVTLTLSKGAVLEKYNSTDDEPVASAEEAEETEEVSE